MKKNTSLKTQIFCSILILSILNACGTNAKILKSDNTHVSGKIVRSDVESVYLEQYGRETKVKRSEILDISHPGKPLMWIGGGAFVGGATTAIVGAVLMSSNASATTSSGYGVTTTTDWNTVGKIYIVSGSILGVAGIVMFFSGYSRYSTSKGNLQSGTGMTFWSPAPGVYLGYQSVMQMPISGAVGGETIHQGRLSFRF